LQNGSPLSLGIEGDILLNLTPVRLSSMTEEPISKFDSLKMQLYKRGGRPAAAVKGGSVHHRRKKKKASPKTKTAGGGSEKSAKTSREYEDNEKSSKKYWMARPVGCRFL